MSKPGTVVQVLPTDTPSRLPLWARKHFIRCVATNGRTLWHSEPYATRGGAVRAAKVAAGDRVRIHVIDGGDRIVRVIFPKVDRRGAGAR